RPRRLDGVAREEAAAGGHGSQIPKSRSPLECRVERRVAAASVSRKREEKRPRLEAKLFAHPHSRRVFELEDDRGRTLGRIDVSAAADLVERLVQPRCDRPIVYT